LFDAARRAKENPHAKRGKTFFVPTLSVLHIAEKCEPVGA
jgi:hypothetical protein